MTTHEADRRADYGAVEEQGETDGSDVLSDEQLDPGTDTDADVAEADVAEVDVDEPVDDQPDMSVREHDAVDDDADEVGSAEPELVDTDELGEPHRAELVDEGDAIDPAERTPESDHPVEKLSPVGPDAAIDPGTGSYEDRWGAIQAGFIDDPRRTVESASALVAEIWDDIASAITDEREGIADRSHTTESSTDDLRVAMQDYRGLYARFMRFTSGEKTEDALRR